MGDVVIRPARPEEYEIAGSIAVEAYSSDGLLDGADDYGDHLSNTADRAERAELLVAADEDGTVLGSVTVAAHGTPYADIAGPGELEFRMLAIAPGAQGRGIGVLLTQAVLDRGRAGGFARVVLSVVDTNAKAARLYQRLGFRRLPERDWNPVPAIRLHVYGFDMEPAAG